MTATLIVLTPWRPLIDRFCATEADAMEKAIGILAAFGPIMPITVLNGRGESIFTVRPLSIMALRRAAEHSENGGVS